MLRSISIQGAGIVSPYGINNSVAVSAFFDSPKETHLPLDDSISQIQIRHYLSEYQREIPDVRYMDAVAKKGIIAARGSIDSAKISGEDIKNDPYRYGILLATKRGPAISRRKLYESLTSRQGKSVSATVFSNCGYNIAASLIAGFFGLKGVNLTLSGSPNLALSLLQRAATFLYTKRLDTVFVGFSDTSNGTDHPGRITLADASCILCIKRATNESNEKRSSIECVEKQTLSSLFVIREPLRAGSIYGISRDSSTPRRQLIDLEARPHQSLYADNDYLLFLQLAYLWTNTLSDRYEKFILPVHTRNDEVFLMVSNDREHPRGVSPGME